MANDLEHYLSLNYRIELQQEDGGFVARHPDLEGCISQGETADEAVASLAEARGLWLEECLDAGLEIPEPAEPRGSGRLLLRMARSLHSRLAGLAEKEGVSLNQLVNQALSEYVGRAGAASRLAEALEKQSESLAEIRSAMQGIRNSLVPDEIDYYASTLHTGSAFQYLRWQTEAGQPLRGYLGGASTISDDDPQSTVVSFDEYRGKRAVG